MILLVSNKWDITVDFVVRELRSRQHEFLRMNTEDINQTALTIGFDPLSIRYANGNQAIELSDHVNVIWNRRPEKPFSENTATEYESEINRFLNEQWHAALESLQLIENVTWVNDPFANKRFENKIHQLWLAQQVGFCIPRTAITNDPDVVHAQLDSGSPTIVKALERPLIEFEDQDYFIFSERIDKLSSSDYKAIGLSPIIVQEEVIDKIDYRVTVVGDVVMPAKIVRTSDELDWRKSKAAVSFSRASLPSEIIGRCRRYVKDAGLLFGAIDLVKDDHQYYFLEINPNGEWGWLQKNYEFPIAEALCDLLIAHDTAE